MRQATAEERRRRRAELAALRGRIQTLEQGAAPQRAAPLGLAALDAALPGGGLPLGALHEVEGARAEWDDGVATAFCLRLLAPLLARAAGPRLWIGRGDDRPGGGLATLGFDPGRLILVRAENDAEALWALEEGLRSAAVPVVVGEVQRLDLTAGRRLQLAAEKSGVTALVLRRRLSASRAAEAPSAAVTAWRIAPAASAAPVTGTPLDRLSGRPRWRVELRRCRGAAPAGFLVEWNDATGGFALAAALRDGALAPEPAESGGTVTRLAG